MKDFLKKINKLKPIFLDIINLGGIPYLVGGSVRDFVLAKDVKDIDIEIHKISLKELEGILKKFGHVRFVGKKFGVLRIDGIDVDWSLPRRDSIGRKPKVKIDPNISIKDALHRRDLTINAMAIDLSKVLDKDFKKNIIDPFGGLKDIKDKKLRAVDKSFFIQDPLRLFRVMQFLARFEMQPDRVLDNICKKISLKDSVTGKKISRERIFDEIKKLLLKSKKPSLGFGWLRKIGRLKDIFPELYDLIGVKQKKIYHPEGDVFEHTMQTIDVAASLDLVNLDLYKDENEKFLIILSLLCHDLGKPETTDESLSAKGHEKLGVAVAKKLLKRITRDKILIASVCKLVLYHMRPVQLLEGKAKSSAYKRLAIKLEPQVNMRQLGIVTLIDKLGRKPKAVIKEETIKRKQEVLNNRLVDKKYFREFEIFLSKVKNLKIESGSEKPVLLGRDILDLVKPGPQMGEILKLAYKIQIEEGVKDKEALKKRVLR